MFFEAIFDILTAIIKEKIPEIIIVKIIVNKLFMASSGISWDIATDAPVLVLFIEYKVTNDKPIIIVFTDPIKKRNSLWSFMFAKYLPINAAWELPIAGRNAVNGADIIDASDAFNIDFFESFIFFIGLIFCSGIIVFCFILITRLLDPNNPVNKGSNGSLTFKLREAIPKNPAIKNINKDNIFLSLSE